MCILTLTTSVLFHFYKVVFENEQITYEAKNWGLIKIMFIKICNILALDYFSYIK